MKKLLALVLALAMILSMAACGDSSSASTGGDEAASLKIAIICDDGGPNDNGYNQSAIEGAETVADSLGVEYKVIDQTESVGDTMTTLAEDGYNIIFSMVYDFDALINGEGGADPIAQQFPDTTFVVFNATPNDNENGEPIFDNVISVLYNVNESSYLAGALSALVIENQDVLFGDGYDFTPVDEGGRAVGFIGATNSAGIAVFGAGYAEGVEYVAKDLGVTYTMYAKNDAGFADSAAAASTAGTYYSNGANIVYCVAGTLGDAVASKAKEVGKLAIHCDANKDAQQPGYILTSVIKNTKVVVETLCQEYTDGTLADRDRDTVFDLASGSTSITDLAEISAAIADTDEAQAKWEEITAYVQDLSDKISDGTIVVTNTQNGDPFDGSTCPDIEFVGSIY